LGLKLGSRRTAVHVAETQEVTLAQICLGCCAVSGRCGKQKRKNREEGRLHLLLL